MTVFVSEAVNGNEIVGRLFWDFAGKDISLPGAKGNYPRKFFWSSTGGRLKKFHSFPKYIYL